MVDIARARKLGERIQEIVAETLELRIKDPRLGFITVTDCKVSPDLHDATVFYTVYGTDQEAISTAAALESARGMIRTEIGRRTGVKFTPSVSFIRDALPTNVQAIDDLLAAAQAADSEVQQRARQATYAGDSDPYKRAGDDQ
ncbi:MAG: 30S ribosome-binding factor RbfA [Actinomycetes bacterium]